MASYARPFQHMTFYEIDDKIRQFNLGTFDLPDGVLQEGAGEGETEAPVGARHYSD